MGIKETKKNIDLFLSQEDMLFTACKTDVAKKNPPPEKEKIYPSIKFFMALIVGISIFVASGTRVFDRFYTTAFSSSQNATLANTESFSAVIGVNGSLIAMAFVIAYRNKKTSENSITWSLWIAGAISLFAGLGQSFNGLGITKATGFFDWMLAVILSGLTILEFLSGDIMGAEWVAFEKRKQETKKQFDEQYDKWLVGVRKQFGAWKARFMKWEDGLETGSTFVPVHSETTLVRKQTKKQKQNKGTQKNYIMNLVQELFDGSQTVPSFTDVAERFANRLEIGSNEFDDFVRSKKSSISQARTEWMKNNGFVD